MVQRSVALWDGKYIGIETIFTVIDGKQINEPEALAELREKSRKGELFCTCGCQANLILVAGDKNLREQHFRVKAGTGKYECTGRSEGKLSIDSKIVLKCWLDDKLHARDIQARVPIDSVEQNDRKPEFTFLSLSKRFAIRYWHTRANIEGAKIDVLQGNLSGITVVYIVDKSNGGGVGGQYPEALMRIQERQGYCLLLDVREMDYSEAILQATYYQKDLDGLWSEIKVCENKITDIDIYENQLFFHGNPIAVMLDSAKEKFEKAQKALCKQREIDQKKLEETRRKQQEEQERRWLEWERCQAEEKLENEKMIQEIEKQKREAEEQRREERNRKEREFRKILGEDFSKIQTTVVDEYGIRWVQCEICGRRAPESEFSSYGGEGRCNLGKCKSCSSKQGEEWARNRHNATVAGVAEKKKYNRTICPECGGALRERYGNYGPFWGCSNFPTCRFSRRIK